MNRRDLLKGFVGTTLVAATADAGSLIIPGKKEIEIVSVDPAISTKPPFGITGWSIQMENNLDPRMGLDGRTIPGLGRLYERLTVDFEIHSDQMFYMTRQCGKDAYFTWELPVRRHPAPIDDWDWDWVRVNGVTESIEITAEAEADHLVAGRLKALVIEKT